jgi:hypothetical protein
MAFIDCPDCGRKVNAQADACRSCGRRLTDPITRLKAELARIDAEWERERSNFVRDYGHRWATPAPRRLSDRAAGGVQAVVGLLVAMGGWLAVIRRSGL